MNEAGREGPELKRKVLVKDVFVILIQWQYPKFPCLAKLAKSTLEVYSACC